MKMSFICRLCLTSCCDLMNLLEHPQLHSEIQSSLSLQITSVDELPKTVCKTCADKVNNWFEFKEMCYKSESILKGRIKDEKDKQLPEESTVETENVNSKEGLSQKQTCTGIEENLKFEVNEDFLENAFLENEENDSDFNDFTEDLAKDEELDHLIGNNETHVPFLYSCDICCKEFDTCIEYLDHHDEHEGQPVYRCETCTEVFVNKADLAQHEQNHKLSCKICSKMVLKTSMKLHLISHTDRHKCLQCHQRCASKSMLEQHVVTVHKKLKNHVCDNCGKSFSTKTALWTHAKIHSEEREYKCKLCDYAGHTASAIYIHMSKHMNESRSCEWCGKIFKSIRNLKDHQHRVHIKERKHKCPHCGIAFIQKYLLRVHLRTHTGFRPYWCEVCDKTFIRSDSLKSHMETHGPRSEYSCSKCFKKFMTKRGRSRHNCPSVADTERDDRKSD